MLPQSPLATPLCSSITIIAAVFWGVFRRWLATSGKANHPDIFPLSRSTFWDHPNLRHDHDRHEWGWHSRWHFPTFWLFFSHSSVEFRQRPPQSLPPHCPLSISSGDKPCLVAIGDFQRWAPLARLPARDHVLPWALFACSSAHARIRLANLAHHFS